MHPIFEALTHTFNGANLQRGYFCHVPWNPLCGGRFALSTPSLFTALGVRLHFVC